MQGFSGANGAGKSTTIKMLTSILHPTSGDAKVLIVRAGAMLETPGRASGQGLGIVPHGVLDAARAPESVEQLVEPRNFRSA